MKLNQFSKSGFPLQKIYKGSKAFWWDGYPSFLVMCIAKCICTKKVGKSQNSACISIALMTPDMYYYTYVGKTWNML